MATYTLTIPKWKPTSVNRLLSGHWSKGYRLKKQDANRVALEARAAGIPTATGSRRVSVTVTVCGRGRSPDADGVLKSLLDSLVAAKLLRDDGPAWMELGEVRVERGKELVTTIVLEDLPS